LFAEGLPATVQHIIGLGKGRISQSMTGMGRNAKAFDSHAPPPP
jgi:hypothetical protein